MDKENYLLFLNDISKDKPNDLEYTTNNSQCPFCDRSNLENIKAEKGPFILLENKYATLKDTYQLVLIETYTCDQNMSEYEIEYLTELISFGIDSWFKLEKTGAYKSVIYYKNHGPHSGGTLKHPHMQIVGLNNIDYKEKLKKEYFEGIEVYKNNSCEVNLSTKPLSGFSEFNIIIDDKCTKIDELSINIKKITHYILNNYFVKCDSFNMYFYHWNSKIICKITPRFTTSPLLLGYSIKQVLNCSKQIVQEIKKIYYQKKFSNF